MALGVWGGAMCVCVSVGVPVAVCVCGWVGECSGRHNREVKRCLLGVRAEWLCRCAVLCVYCGTYHVHLCVDEQRVE